MSQIPSNPFSTQFDPAHFKRDSSDFCRSMAESVPWKTQGFGIFQPVNSRKSRQQEQDRGSPCLPAPLSVFQRYWVIRRGFRCLDYAPTNYRLFFYNIKPRDHKKEFGEANLLVFCTRAAQNLSNTPQLTLTFFCASPALDFSWASLSWRLLWSLSAWEHLESSSSSSLTFCWLLSHCAEREEHVSVVSESLARACFSSALT